MIGLCAQFLVTPISVTGPLKLLLLLPLTLAIAVVYKATRLERLRDLPAAVLGLWVTIILGMYAVGVSLWAVYRYLA